MAGSRSATGRRTLPRCVVTQSVQPTVPLWILGLLVARMTSHSDPSPQPPAPPLTSHTALASTASPAHSTLSPFHAMIAVFSILCVVVLVGARAVEGSTSSSSSSSSTGSTVTQPLLFLDYQSGFQVLVPVIVGVSQPSEVVTDPMVYSTNQPGSATFLVQTNPTDLSDALTLLNASLPLSVTVQPALGSSFVCPYTSDVVSSERPFLGACNFTLSWNSNFSGNFTFFFVVTRSVPYNSANLILDAFVRIFIQFHQLHLPGRRLGV